MSESLDAKLEVLKAALDSQGIGYKVVGTGSRQYRLELDRCLTSDAHKDGAKLFVYGAGYGYTCHHDSCEGKHYADVQAKYKLPRNQKDKAKRVVQFQTIGVLRQRPAPIPLVAGMLFEATLAAIVADSGSFKSFIALDIALSIAFGLPVFDRETTRGAACFIAAEGSGGVVRRIDAWLKHRGIPDDPANFHILPESLILTSDRDALHAAIAELPEPPALIVIDTLNRTYQGDENSADDMGRYVRAGDSLREAFGCTVLILHHNSKQGQYRGSSAFIAALDTMITLDKTDFGVQLECGKQKDAAEFAPINLEKRVIWLNDDSIRDDANLLEMDEESSLVFVLSERETVNNPFEKLILLTKMQRKALEALADLNKRDDWESWTAWWEATGGTKSNFSNGVVKKLEKAGMVERESRGRAKYFRITIAGLIALGRIIYIEGKATGRSWANCMLDESPASA